MRKGKDSVVVTCVRLGMHGRHNTRSGLTSTRIAARLCRMLHKKFREFHRLLKNSLGAPSHSTSGTKHTDFEAFRARFVAVTSSMQTFSTACSLLGTW
jgi:hypothetical protein